MDPFLIPLQFGVPGGPELLVMLLMFALWGIVPLVVVALVLYYLHGINSKLERLVELQE